MIRKPIVTAARLLVLAMSIAVTAVSGNTRAAGFDRLAIFGDSLSDTGNRASITFSFPWPYYQNRVSNGPVAVDAVAAGLGLDAGASLHLISAGAGWNYAVAGANAQSTSSIDLDNQVLSFLDRVGNNLGKRDLMLVFIGGNDVRAAAVASSAQAANTLVTLAVQRIRANLLQLIAAGARRILVVNLPDIGSIPEADMRAAEDGDPGLPGRATALTLKFNDELEQAMAGIAAATGTVPLVVDFHGWFNGVLGAPLLYGFSNIDDACFVPDQLSFHPDCDFGTNFDDFIFFDPVHPTAAMHALAGGFILERIRFGTNLAGILLLLLGD